MVGSHRHHYSGRGEHSSRWGLEECRSLGQCERRLQAGNPMGQSKWSLEEGDITMFDGIPVDKLTPPLLLLLAVLMVLLGLLVPRWTYKRLEKERDDWKLAFEVERESRLALQGQTKELLEL